MAERQTLLARNTADAPVVRPQQTGAPDGAFGDFQGVRALGQGLQQVGNTGTDVAIGYQQKFEQQRQREIADAKSQHEKDVAEFEHQEMRRVQVDFQTTINATARGISLEKERQSDSYMQDPVKTTEGIITSARSSFFEAVNKQRASAGSRFDKAIPGGQKTIEGEFESAVQHLRLQSMEDGFKLNQAGRVVGLKNMIDSSFVGAAVDHERTLSELGKIWNHVDASKIYDPLKKLALKEDAAANATNQFRRGISMGNLLSADFIKGLMLSPAQKHELEAANAQYAPKVPSILDSRTTLKSAQDEAVATGSMDPLHRPVTQQAAAIVDAHGTNEDTKQAGTNNLNLTAWQVAIERSLVNLTPTEKGKETASTVRRLHDLQTSWKNPETMKELRTSLMKPGVTEEKFKETIDHIQGFAKNVDRLVQTNRGNEIFAMSPSGSAADSKATAAFKEWDGENGVPEEIRSYSVGNQSFQTAYGIPPEQQNLVPTGVISSFIKYASDGSMDNAHQVMANIGSAFGAQGLRHLANYLASPSGVAELEQGRTPGSMSMRSPELAAIVLVAGIDQKARDVGGKSSLGLTSSIKPFFEAIKNYEAKKGEYDPGSSKAAQFTFSVTSFKDPITLKKIESGSTFLSDSSDYQSFSQMYVAIDNTYGKDLAEGFRGFVMKYLQASSDSPTSGGEKDDKMMIGRMAKNANALLNVLSGVMAVVPSSSSYSTSNQPTIVPNISRREGMFDRVKHAGAGNVKDFSESLSGSLDNMLYYTPRKDWDRQGLSNWWTSSEISFRNVFSEFYTRGVDDILPLYPELKIDAANIVGLMPEHYGTGNEDLIQKAMTDPKNRATFNGVVIAQHGHFQYNQDTDSFDLYVEPGRNSPAGTPSTPGLGRSQPVKYKNGQTVSFPRSRVQQYTDSYRALRDPRVIHEMRGFDSGPIHHSFRY